MRSAGVTPARFTRLEEKYHLDQDALENPDAAPPEYRALNLEFAQAANILVVATFQSFGEHKMAFLYQRQPEDFDHRYDAGFEFFFGRDDNALTESDLLKMRHCD